jgi:hypothetical protein
MTTRKYQVTADCMVFDNTSRNISEMRDIQILKCSSSNLYQLLCKVKI